MGNLARYGFMERGEAGVPQVLVVPLLPLDSK
jgi:hypothetical protein